MASNQAEQKKILNEAEEQLLTWAQRIGRSPSPMRPVTAADRAKVVRLTASEPYIMLRQADIFGSYAKVKPIKVTLPKVAPLPPRPENDVPTILPPKQTRSLGAVAASAGRHAVVQGGLKRYGLAEKLERKQSTRRIVALGALAVTAVAAAAGFYLTTKGHHAAHSAAPVHHAAVGPASAPAPSVAPGSGVPPIVSPDRITILPGQGYTNAISSYAQQHGHHLTGAQSYHIYRGVEHKLHANIFTDDPGYAMGDANFGISHTGVATWNPVAVHVMDKMLKHL